MLYNIIESIFINNIYYLIFTPIITGIAFILAILFLVFAFKNKKAHFLIYTVILAFIAYQAVPYFYYLKILSAKSEADMIKNYNLAAKTACSSAYKGFLYADAANYFSMEKNAFRAIEYYDLAYKYLKNYKSKTAWILAPYIYIAAEEYDRAIEISNAIQAYSAAAEAYILKEDYNSALSCIDKVLAKNPKDAWGLAMRAVIYKNLNKNEMAQKDYEEALKLCKYSNCINRTKNSYADYKVWYKNYHKQKRAEYGFK